MQTILCAHKLILIFPKKSQEEDLYKLLKWGVETTRKLMEKNRMKANRVAILMMIMLGFAPILKVEAFSCPILCALECFVSLKRYALCFIECMIKCELPLPVSKCASSCDVNKRLFSHFGVLFNFNSQNG